MTKHITNKEPMKLDAYLEGYKTTSVHLFI